MSRQSHHLDLIRVVEAGAVAASEWVGRGNKGAADKAASEAMRAKLNEIPFLAEIAIGEGVKDDSYGLFEGELVGAAVPQALRDGDGRHLKPYLEQAMSEGVQAFSIAIDPIEGTTPTSKGGYEAMSVVASGDYGCFFKTSRFYMDKLAVGRRLAEASLSPDLKFSAEENVILAGQILGKDVREVVVCLLDRPRNAGPIERLRKLGCRLKLIQDCDVTACIATCTGAVDMYLGIGGSPEAVLAAAAVKCLRGKFQAVEVDGDHKPVGDVYGQEQLAKGNVVFCAAGITDGLLLKGVGSGPVTHAIEMRSETGTYREIRTVHG